MDSKERDVTKSCVYMHQLGCQHRTAPKTIVVSFLWHFKEA